MENRNSIQIRNILFEGLEAAIPNRQFAPANHKHEKPPYPYGTLNVITPKNQSVGLDILTETTVPSTNPSFTSDKIQRFSGIPEMTISVNAYGLTEESAVELAYQMYDWFNRGGELYMDLRSLYVIDSGDIEQRDILIQDEYERRFGFDVRIRYTRYVERRIETIETATLN